MTILEGVTQERRGALQIESYFQRLLSPQGLQLDTRNEDLGILYLSDYDTGYIYTVRRVARIGGPGRHRKSIEKST